MSNRRIQKKVDARRERTLAERAVDARYAVQKIVVSVPCPKCGAEQLERTYIPALGSMNGDVRCEKCDFEDSYLASLANVMTPVDPLPSDYLARPTPSLLYMQERPRPTRVQVMLSYLRGFASFMALAFRPERRMFLRMRPAARARVAQPRRLATSVVGRP